jgi:branched-chain amino acid transport system substrate-binding protein
MTGPAAFIGQGQSKTLEIIEQMVNAKGGIQGHPIHFASRTIRAIRRPRCNSRTRSSRKKPALVHGPGADGRMCAAVLPLARTGPVDYCMSPGIEPPAGSYVYSAGMAGPDLAKLYVRYFHRRGWNRIALITSTDATGQLFEKSFNDSMALAGKCRRDEAVAREHFNSTDLSVVAQMSRIKVRNAQVLIAWTAGAGFGTICTRFRKPGSTCRSAAAART